MKFTLDVLVPHYRSPDGLKASLDSIARQTWRGRLRVIVVDDGSPRSEFHAAEAHCEAFRIESGFDLLLLRNETNLGRPRTRNRLLEAAEASHVAWLDAEDVWYPEKLRLQFEELARLAYQGEDIDSVWVTCSYDWQQNGSTSTVRQHLTGDQLEELLIGSRLRSYLWTLLGTRRAFQFAGRFDERLPRLQDLDYFINFVRAGGRLVSPAVDEPLCRYFKSDLGRAASEVRNSYKLILSKNAPVLNRFPTTLSARLHFRANWLGARFAINNRQVVLAARYLIQAVLCSPREAASYLKWRMAKLMSLRA